jgi:hypothetical protein
MRPKQTVMTALVGAAMMLTVPLSAFAHDHNYHSNYSHSSAVARNFGAPARNFSSFHATGANFHSYANNAATGTAPWVGRAYANRYGANYASVTAPVWNNGVRPWNTAAAYPTNSYGGGYYPNYGAGYAPSYAPAYGGYAAAPVAAYPAYGQYGGYANGNCNTIGAENRTAKMASLLQERSNLGMLIAQARANGNYSNAHRLNTQREYANQLLGNYPQNGCARENLGMATGVPYANTMPYANSMPYNNSYAGYNGYNGSGNRYGGGMGSMLAPMLQGFIR